jgi:hypothetical protein
MNKFRLNTYFFRESASQTGARIDKPGAPGITVNWKMFMSDLAEAFAGKTAPKATENPVSDQPAEAPGMTLDAGDDEARKLLIENPTISAATFYNLLKSKGLRIVPTTQADVAKAAGSAVKEAEGGSAHVAALREADRMKLPCRFMESSARDNGIGPTKFRVILLQEGMGNLADNFFYTKEALESLAPIMEGAKIFANHPRASEEEDLPERDVRDIIGHYENVSVIQGDEGQAQLIADVCILPDEPYRWARALLSHAVEYAKKYPDKDFVGLSINAGGYGEPVPLAEFLKDSTVPKHAIPKLQKAVEEGVETVRVVRRFTEAVSTDLVTKAGAGGKVLQALEADK